MPLTNLQKAKLLNHYYGNTPLEAPEFLYVGLSLSAPTEEGENFTEPDNEDGYARVKIANDTTTWAAATVDNPSIKTNDVPIEFPEATGDWGAIKYWGIFEQETGGTCIDWAELSIHKVISNGDAARFKPGELRTILRNPELPSE